MTTQIRLFEKFQLNIERGQLKSCQICGTKFSVFVAEHQCKRCLRAVCSGCGSAKRDVYKPQMGRKPHRLCKICNIESTILIEYISANKLTFGSDSEIGRKWRKKIPKPTRDPTNVKKQRKFTVQIFNQLWDAYNFSLRQFIGLQTYLTGQGDVYKMINTVYQQLQSRGVEQKLENVILMIVFMLCYSNTDTCAHLVEYLCNLKRTVIDQKQMLQAYLRALGIEESEAKKLNDYISYKCKQFLGPFSINAVTAQCSIHAITKAFQRQRIDQTYMLLAIVLQENWDMLLKNRAQNKQCDYFIIRNCNMANYIQKYKTLVSVKVAQFSSIRASVKNGTPEEEDKNKLKQAPIKQEANLSPGSTPPKSTKGKKSNTIDIKLEDKQKEADLRAKALLNIAKIKQRNRKQQSGESLDDAEQKKMQIDHQNSLLKGSAFGSPKLALLDLAGYQPIKQETVKNRQIKFQEEELKNQHITKSEPIVYYQKEQCLQCEKKVEKLQEIQQQLRCKVEQLENTNRVLKSAENQVHRLKLEVKQLQEQFRTKRQESKESPEELERVKQQMVEITQKYNNLMKQFIKYQRQNKTLKNELEELGLNNKILKSKLEQNSMGLGITVKTNQNEQQLTRMNELLKKSIQGKNKELQALAKKNKELLAQLDENLKSKKTQNSKDSQKASQLQREKDQLISKMKDLGDRIVKEQEQKLNLSSQLFELKRSQSVLPEFTENKNEPVEKTSDAKNRVSECLIF